MLFGEEADKYSVDFLARCDGELRGFSLRNIRGCSSRGLLLLEIVPTPAISFR
jgi:hypothetical protein